MRTYSCFECWVCHQRFSMAGRTAHLRRHVREGKLEERLYFFDGKEERRFEAVKKPPPTADPFPIGNTNVIPQLSMVAVKTTGTTDHD